MPSTYKRLGAVAPLATTETDLYVVPALTQTVSSSVVVANRGNTSTTFRVTITVGGGATTNVDYIYPDVSIPGNDTFIATVGVTLNVGDTVRVYAGNANLTFSMWGVELASTLPQPAFADHALVLCAGFTPSGTGADVVELVVPYATDGVTPITWSVTRLTLRVETAGGAPSMRVEKSTVAGVFTPATIGTVTLGVGAYEGSVTAALGTVDSGNKLRFHVLALGTAANWTIIAEIGV